MLAAIEKARQESKNKQGNKKESFVPPVPKIPKPHSKQNPSDKKTPSIPSLDELAKEEKVSLESEIEKIKEDIKFDDPIKKKRFDKKSCLQLAYDPDWWSGSDKFGNNSNIFNIKE
ncbi:2743_t:CDS:2 [Ambispora gerdemannii]|uniref:2743_t:CDS:1 n=1 Tax=Ambispora gerdemannii TaxID=144530 RepID=A0A9N9DB44_9GLOM|nr:2743_t:CDS:2 [Ambispora gerdemannii]